MDEGQAASLKNQAIERILSFRARTHKLNVFTFKIQIVIPSRACADNSERIAKASRLYGRSSKSRPSWTRSDLARAGMSYPSRRRVAPMRRRSPPRVSSRFEDSACESYGVDVDVSG